MSTSGYLVPAHGWQHVAVALSPGQIVIYVDGERKETVAHDFDTWPDASQDGEALTLRTPVPSLSGNRCKRSPSSAREIGQIQGAGGPGDAYLSPERWIGPG